MQILNILNVWKYRQLLYFLVWREIKIRYKQAFFGIAWAILTPLSQAIIFAIIFGYFLKIPTGGTPYLLIVFSGFVFWNFFSQSVATATYALTGNYNLVTKSVFPKEVLVLASVIGRLPDLLSSFLIIIAILIFYKINLSLIILLVIPLLLLEIILVLGVSLFFASTNVYYRDITALVPLVLTLWLYVSPVMYTIDAFPDKWRAYSLLNPMTGILEGMRDIIFDNQFPEILPLKLSIIITTIIFITSYILFKRLEKGFADTI